MTYVTATGKRLASMNTAFGVVDAADVEIVCGNPAAILHEATTNEVEYVFDDSITGITETPRRRRGHLRAVRTRLFHTVAGADGLHSRMWRVLAFGLESQFVRHPALYLSVSTVLNEMGLHQWQLIHVAPGRSVTAATTTVTVTVLPGTADPLYSTLFVTTSPANSTATPTSGCDSPST